MKKIVSVLVFLLFLFLNSLAFAQTTTEFQDGVFPDGTYAGTQDSFLRQTSPTSNFGSETFLSADGTDQDPGNGLFGEVVSVIQWDVSAIPSGATVQSASISLEITDTSSGPYEIYSVDTGWTEGGVTYGDIASDIGGMILGTISPGNFGQNVINLNPAGVSLVQGWVNGGTPNNGIIIRSGGTNNGIDANSREAASATTRPKLTVDYTTASATMQSFQNGVSPSPTYAGTEDSSIRETSPTSNFGNDTSLSADGVAQDPGNGLFGELQSVVKWDVSSISPTAMVQSASIFLDLTNVSSGNYEIYSVGTSWNEGTVDWNGIAPSVGATLLGTITPGQFGENEIILNKDGEDLIQSWINDSNNNNGIVIQSSGTNDGIVINSSEAAVATTRPRLKVVYMDSPMPMESFEPEKDSYVSENAPNTNFGSETFLSADGDDGGGELVSVIAWDLSVIPAGSVIQSASITLDLFDVSSGNYQIVSNDTAWDEGTVTWNSLGSNFGTTSLGTILPFQFNENVIDLNQDGIQLIQDWVDGIVPNNGVAIRTVVTTNGIDMNSREAASGRPILKVTYTPGSEVMVMEDADEDATIRESSPTDNFGSDIVLLADGSDQDANGFGEVRSVIHWNLSGVPSNANVQSVSVHFNLTNISGGPYELYSVDNSWSEGTVTWNDITSIGSTLLGTITPGQFGENIIDLNLDGIALIQGWIDGSIPNDGIIVRSASGVNDGIDFNSSEAASGRPKITIIYSPVPILPPDILAVNPNMGAATGGEFITVSGENFTSNTDVTICSQSANVTFVNSQTLIARTPPCSKGFEDVTVANPNGMDTLVDGFNYNVDIKYSDIVSETITPVGDQDSFTFKGTLGDQLWIRMKPLTGGIEAALWVLRPDGTTLCSQAASGGNSGLLTLDVADGCTLDVTGTHTVVVADSGGNESGDYEMLLQRRNPMAGTEAINYGDDVTRTISPFVDLDGYTFSGTLGDQLWIRMKPLTGGIEAALWVLRPDGTTLCSQAASGGNSGLLTLVDLDGYTFSGTLGCCLLRMGTTLYLGCYRNSYSCGRRFGWQ